MGKVLWNNEMDLCIGLITEQDKEEFEANAVRSHIEKTGHILHPGDYIISEDDTTYRLEIVEEVTQDELFSELEDDFDEL